MTLDASIPALLNTLTTSLESAGSSTPESSSLVPPADGISLLDTKNELLLSYLQNLVFLILLKLRDLKSTSTSAPRPSNDDDDDDDDRDDHDHDEQKSQPGLQNEVVKKLVELRLYLEKGVRPLEGKLKYQIDKVVRAAETSGRAATIRAHPTTSSSKNQKQKRQHGTGEQRQAGGDSDAGLEEHQKLQEQEEENKGSDMETGSSDRSDSDSDSGSGSVPDSDSDVSIDDLAYRPNPSAFAQPAAPSKSTPSSSSKPSSRNDGIYRPPRIAPVSLPTTDHHSRAHKSSSSSGPKKSSVLDDFIATELSGAPVAEPSIGSTIAAKGRETTSARDRELEKERTEYEEANFVRLPRESKKERAKRMRSEGGKRNIGFGGEEWRGLGEGADRIERLTAKRKDGGGGGKMRGLVERGRKRVRDVTGNGDGGGVPVGERFEKRRKMVERRGR